MAPSDIDTAERIVRLETKLDFIIASIASLPPSPTCTAKHKELEDEIDAIKKWRDRAMGAMLVINILVVILMDKIRALFFPT